MKFYPNLELLEYKCIQIASELYTNTYTKHPEIDANVFVQSWANTATGFDYYGGFSGQAFTDEYTTVFEIMFKHDTIYAVCFGNNVAYMIHEPNDLFYNDLTNRSMLSQKYSEKYGDVKIVRSIR